VVRFEPVARNKRRISVYPPEIYPVGGARELLLPATTIIGATAAPAAGTAD
jgi:hypothetical protein